MIQSTLDRFLSECDLRRLFEAVVDTEAWEAVRITVERYAAESGMHASWNGDGFQGEKTVVLHGPACSDWLDMTMDAWAVYDEDEDPPDFTFGTGQFSLHGEFDFCWLRRDYDWYLDLADRRNRKALEVHRRFFEILAEEMGMRLTGWGPEGQVWISVEHQARMRAREVEA